MAENSICKKLKYTTKITLHDITVMVDESTSLGFSILRLHQGITNVTHKIKEEPLNAPRKKKKEKKHCNKKMECRNTYAIKSFLCYHMLFIYKQRVMTSGCFLSVPAHKKAGALG